MDKKGQLRHLVKSVISRKKSKTRMRFNINSLVIVILFASGSIFASIHDKETDQTLKQLGQFCRSLKTKGQTCEKLRKEFLVSFKAVRASVDPCGPTKVAIKLKNAFPGAKQLAEKMSKAKANIKPAPKPGQKKKKSKKGEFELGTGKKLNCKLKV